MKLRLGVYREILEQCLNKERLGKIHVLSRSEYNLHSCFARCDQNVKGPTCLKILHYTV